MDEHSSLKYPRDSDSMPLFDFILKPEWKTHKVSNVYSTLFFFLSGWPAIYFCCQVKSLHEAPPAFWYKRKTLVNRGFSRKPLALLGMRAGPLPHVKSSTRTHSQRLLVLDLPLLGKARAQLLENWLLPSSKLGRWLSPTCYSEVLPKCRIVSHCRCHPSNLFLKKE